MLRRSSSSSSSFLLVTCRRIELPTSPLHSLIISTTFPTVSISTSRRSFGSLEGVGADQQPVNDKEPLANLAADLPARFMKWSDFDALCQKHRVPHNATRDAANKLAKCGAVVISEDGVHGHAAQAVRDACEALGEPWNPVADLEATASSLRNDLKALRPAYEAQLNRAVRARRATWSGAFAFTGVQLAVFARLTYFDLDWDTMEPVSYFLGSGIGVLGFFWMLSRGFDFSNREVDREVVRKKYVAHPDVVKYFETLERLEKVEKEIDAIMVWVRTGKCKKH